MANLVAASIYGQNKNDWGSAHGTAMAFPGTGFIARPTTEVMSGVQMAAIIQVLPTGLTVDGTQYYTDSTVAELVTAANAALA